MAVTKDSEGAMESELHSMNAVDVTSVIASDFSVTSSNAVSTLNTANENIATH